MEWFEKAAEAVWSAFLIVVTGLAFAIAAAVFAGAMAKHALDVGAGKHRWFGLAWKVRMVVGVSCTFAALGIVEQFGLTGWTAVAVANLIGFAGMELILQLALMRIRAMGFELSEFKKKEEVDERGEG
jgi:hypothetical protein